MDNTLFHLVEINVILVICTLIYYAFRSQLSHAQKRFTILSIPALALLIYGYRLIGFSGTPDLYNFPVYQLETYTVKPGQNQESLSNWFNYALIYWTGFALFAAVFIYRLIRLKKILRAGSQEKRDGLKILHLQNQECFSFLNFVQLKTTLEPRDELLILEHEKIHIAKKHSYDILFMQVMQCIHWFNPVMLLLKKELINVHEYQVDEIMYNRHKAEYMEFLLSYSLGTSSTPYLLTNQFYSKNTLIKRMNFMKQKTKNRWFLALMIPVTAASLSLVSWTYANGHKPTPISSVEGERIYGSEVDKMPEFKGGQEALVEYLGTHVRYPEQAKKDKVEGTVYVGFTVEKTGKISNCSIKRGVSPALDEEALQVVSTMPDWVPGESEGKKVNVEMTLPINFKL